MTLSSKLHAACKMSLGPERASHSLYQATPISVLAGCSVVCDCITAQAVPGRPQM